MKFETSENLPKYFKTIQKNAPLTAEREKELVVLIQEGDRVALNELIQANLKFVVKMANRHIGQGVPIDDLIQEGNIGLMEAALNFKSDSGSKFISYASLWIRKRLNETVAKTGRLVRLPHNQEYEIYKAKMKGEEVDEPRRIDIDRKVGEDEGVTVGDLILHSGADAEAAIEMDDIKFKVKTALSTLKERDQLIIKDYFGIDCDYEISTNDIADKYQMTNVRVCQIVKASIEKMKIVLC
jgi:RNA polymerase primary sigma factor